MAEWRECSLESVCSRLSSGKGISAKLISERGVYPVYGGNGIRGYTDTSNFKGECAIVGRQGAYCGNVRYFRGEAYMTEHAVVVCANEDNCTRYLAYLLATMNLGRLSAQSAQPGLSVKTLGKQEIRMPDKKVQLKCAELLGSLDEKISHNEEVNKNLTDQIKALCNAWLNNYVPFGGMCPNNWKLTPLSEIAMFVSGYSYKGKELQESSIAMATIKNFDRKGGFKLDGFKEIIPSSKLKPEQHADLFDTLVAHTDLTQNADVIGNAEPVLSLSGYEDIIFSMDVVKVLPKASGISKFLIAAMLQTQRFKRHCLGYVNGTTVLHLSKKALPEYSLMLPSDFSILKPLDNAVTSLYQQMALNIEESTKLTELRDSLLPRLMSGEIDVSIISL